MKASVFLAATATILAISGTASLAQDNEVLPTQDSVFKDWGTEGSWKIYVDESKGSCLAERMDAEKDVLQMGLTKSGDLGYLGVFTLGDGGSEVREQRIKVTLDGKEYEGVGYSATSHLSNDYTGGYILTNNPRLVEDVMNKTEMDVAPQTGKSFDLSLEGTKMAIEAARKCNAEQG